MSVGSERFQSDEGLTIDARDGVIEIDASSGSGRSGTPGSFVNILRFEWAFALDKIHEERIITVRSKFRTDLVPLTDH